MYYDYVIDCPNQDPLNPATCVAFKFLKEVPVSAILSRNELWVVIYYLGEGRETQRLLLGLFHYNNSFYTGQETNKRVLGDIEYAFSVFT